MAFNPHDRRSQRTKLASFSPGHVFRFPPGATWMNRDKSRPFALATRCSPDQAGTLAYGSTQATQKHHGAVCIEVSPVRSGVNANGLTAQTFFYPGILLRAPYDTLPTHSGVIGRSMGELRAAVVIALGIGTGSCGRTGAPARSRRGRIVILHDRFTRLLMTRVAVLLTEHRYSRENAYHLIVPVIGGDERLASDSVLRVDGETWMNALESRPDSVLLPAQVIQSVWYERDVVEETEFVVDEETLDALEGQLCAIFGLSRA